MTDWFRSWHGAPTDPKWLGIARRAGVAPGIAVAVAWALMDRASQSQDRGSIVGYDADGLGYFFGCEPEQVDSIVQAMTDKGVLADGRFASWEKRQPKREDASTERVREHRKRAATQTKPDETQRNAPDTDTDTDTDNSVAEATGASPPDERSLLFGAGLTALKRITGKPDQPARKLIGHWLKLSGDDCVAVRRVIEDAERDRPADPISWIEARFKARQTGPPQRQEGWVRHAL